MSIQSIITLITSICGALAVIIPLGIKLFFAIKTIVKNKDWSKILDLARIAISEAEKTGLTGADKKTIVLASVEASCKEIGIEFNSKEVSSAIDSLITFANTINPHKTEN